MARPNEPDRDRRQPEIRLEPDVERRDFEALHVGEVFELPPRTFDTEVFVAFQRISGDGHPMHYDRVDCRARGHEDILAHGLMVASYGSAGAGAFPYVVEDCILGMLEQSTRFLAPVVRGDRLSGRLRVTELRRQRTTGVAVLELEIDNQRGVRVAEGRHAYLLRLRTSGAGAGG